jgi:hypothetical protein
MMPLSATARCRWIVPSSAMAPRAVARFSLSGAIIDPAPDEALTDPGYVALMREVRARHAAPVA